MSCEYNPVLSLVLLIINYCRDRAYRYGGRFLRGRWRVAWGSHSAAWDRNSWLRRLFWTLSPFGSCCVEQLILLSAACCNVGSVTSDCNNLDLYSDTSCLIKLLSCLEFVLWLPVVPTLSRAWCVYDIKCTIEGKAPGSYLCWLGYG